MDTIFPGIPSHIPVYQLLSACFLDDDTLHMEGEQIAYEGTPNEEMAPLNEPARVKMREYQSYLDRCAREKAALVGRPFQGRPLDRGDQIFEAFGDAKVLEERKRVMPAVSEAAPLRPDMLPMAVRRQRAKNTKVRASRAPQPMGPPAPKPIADLERRDKLTSNAPLTGE